MTDAADRVDGPSRGPTEGRTILGRDVITLKLTAEQTRGSIGVLEATTQPGVGPPRHIHRSCDEQFYVLGREFLFLVGDRRGTAEPCRVLTAYVPGGQEHAFEEFGRSPRDVVAAKHDSEFRVPTAPATESKYRCAAGARSGCTSASTASYAAAVSGRTTSAPGPEGHLDDFHRRRPH